jgi:hypothetical protein
MRRGGVADVGDGKPARTWRRRHPPAHHDQLALGARIANDRCRTVRKNPRVGCKLPTYRFITRNSFAIRIEGNLALRL